MLIPLTPLTSATSTIIPKPMRSISTGLSATSKPGLMAPIMALIPNLQNYLDEFMFRFNRRKTPMAAFQKLLGPATIKIPVNYEKMALGASTG